MKWSIPCGRVLGIALRIHLSFLLLLGWVAWLGWTLAGWSGSLWALLLVNALFGCVVLHELGHSVVAVRFGVTVESITLLPIGGVASMRAIPEKPVQELLIAVAGPLVNVVIAALLLAWPGPAFSAADQPLPTSFAGLRQALLVMNLVLVAFNLVPAFPMDGGRILRSILAFKLSFVTATEVAVRLGQVFAALFVVWGIQHNPVLMLIGVFVFFGARAERARVRMRSVLAGRRVAEIMETRFDVLHPDSRLADCLARGYDGGHHDFPVVAEGRLVGFLPRGVWMAALRRSGVETPVAEVMQRRFLTLYPDADLAELYPRLLAQGQGAFPVLLNGEVVGLVSLEKLQRLARVGAPREGTIRPPRGRTGPYVDLG